MKKLYYRAVQRFLFVVSKLLPWREPSLIEGEGAIEKLPTFVRLHQVSKVLIVCDLAVMQYNLLDGFLKACKALELSTVIYDGISKEPTEEDVMQAKTLYEENMCEGIIGIGGGSAIDAAKACAAQIARPKRALFKMRGLLKVRKKRPPLFAVPTTAGSGSEATIAAVIHDKKRHVKYAINDLVLMPDVAVLDPNLIKTLPPRVSAASGMDALTHAVESYISKTTTKKTRQWALDAVRGVFDYLETTLKDGNDSAAREGMLKASYKAGCAFTRTYVGYVHAIAHTLGARFGIPHGEANAALLVPVLKAYGKRVYKPLSELAQALNLEKVESDEKANAQHFIEAIEALRDALNLPATVDCIDANQIDAMIDDAFKEAHPQYPVPTFLDKNTMRMIIESIMQ